MCMTIALQGKHSKWIAYIHRTGWPLVMKYANVQRSNRDNDYREEMREYPETPCSLSHRSLKIQTVSDLKEMIEFEAMRDIRRNNSW